MELIADGVLVLAATVAGLYCLVLSRRLKSLTQMESGLGKAITSMSAQVDEMRDAISKAKSSTEDSVTTLSAHQRQAEEIAQKLENLIEMAKDLEPAAAPHPSQSASDADPTDNVVTDLRRKMRRPREPENEEADQKRIDGLISSYLSEFEGEDEAAIARRLVSVLTSSAPVKKERAV